MTLDRLIDYLFTVALVVVTAVVVWRHQNKPEVGEAPEQKEL